MAIDAAIDGHGVALARSALAAWDLARRPPGASVRGGAGGALRLLDRVPAS